MEVDYINPIYAATSQVFKNMFQVEVEKGDLKIEEDIIPTQEVNANIGVSGDLNGTIIYSFPEEMTLKIVEEMAGMEMEEVDKFVASAVGELANIISGNAISNYAEKNYDCDIIPPQVNVGEGTTYSTATDKTLVIPLSTSYGDFELNVSIGENKEE